MVTRRDSPRTAKNDLSMKETGQYPGPSRIPHSRVKTPKTYPVHADRRRSIVACPMSLGARVTQTRETREPDRRSGAVSLRFVCSWCRRLGHSGYVERGGETLRDESERGS